VAKKLAVLAKKFVGAAAVANRKIRVDPMRTTNQANAIGYFRIDLTQSIYAEYQSSNKYVRTYQIRPYA